MMLNIKKLCLVCRKEFFVYPNEQNRKQKYCSRKCLYETYKDRVITWGDKISKAKMGHGWPEGYHERQSIAQRKRFKHETIWNKGKYKNGKIGYATIHRWIKREKGKPSFCEICGTEDAKRFEWANISGEYKQELEDWMRLCSRCHVRHDGTINNLKYYNYEQTR
jgi:hypothetical protein